MEPKSNRNGSSIESRALHVGRPHIGDRQIFNELVDGIFERRWFTNSGELVRELELRLAKRLGVKHCLTVCNATVGLQLACRAMELSGEVILPAFTFVASAHAVALSGLKPVFADVDRATHCLSVDSIRGLVSERTSAILGVHLWGQPCEIEGLQSFTEKRGLKLFFDAAHAFDCGNGNRLIGNFGSCEVFSFHATKFFNTFEGGAISTNDDLLADKIRKLRNFGFEGPEQIGLIGTNAKMAEINAAMGLSMLEVIDSIKATNRENFELYQTLLAGVDGLRLITGLEHGVGNWQYVVLEVDSSRFGSTRDSVFEELNRRNIFAKRYFFPGCHRLKPYRDEFRASGRKLSNTDQISQQVLCLPTGTAVDRNDIKRVCETVLSCRSGNSFYPPRAIRKAAS